VSPHADDVAFSAAAQLDADVAAGARVALLTLFTPPRDPKGHSDPELRRDEDEAFAGMARATLLDGCWPDALERRPRYRRARHLFEPLRDDEAPLVEAVRTKLASLVADGCRKIVAPLGVGHHVDHQVAHAAARAVDGAEVRFYEDTPYVLTRYQLPRRLARLGVGPADVGGDETLARGTRRQELGALARTLAAAPFLRARVPAGMRPLAIATLLLPEVRSGGRRRVLARAFPSVLVGARVAAVKRAAIAAYGSQWPLYHPTLDAWQDALTAYARAMGRTGLVERSWRIAS
jgi:hypothetical protein